MSVIFCNVHLLRVPRSWTGSIQMKSSMIFIRGYRYIYREKDNFKSQEVKRLKKCALPLNTVVSFIDTCMRELIVVFHIIYDISESTIRKRPRSRDTRHREAHYYEC